MNPIAKQILLLIVLPFSCGLNLAQTSTTFDLSLGQLSLRVKIQPAGDGPRQPERPPHKFKGGIYLDTLQSKEKSGRTGTVHLTGRDRLRQHR